MSADFKLSRRQLISRAFLISLGGIGLASCSKFGKRKIRYGITPYQDSALPVVAKVKGWYAADGLDVELVPLSWDQVITGLSSRGIDVAIYNFNSFMASYANAAQRSPKPLFYAPLYVFKGQAILVRGDRGYKTVGTLTPTPREVAAIAAQLKGLRIAVTKGTELEQIVLAALSAAGLTANDVTIINAAPEDSLAAFLSGNIDAFAGGLTERIEAQRHGAVPLLTQADVMSPVTDGLVTTDEFAKDNQATLDGLLLNWFKTITYISENIEANSAEIREYLKNSASTTYSPVEYKIAWSFDVFPRNAKEAIEIFDNPQSPSYWRTSWNGVNNFLLDQKQITSEVPYSAYTGTEVLARLAKM